MSDLSNITTFSSLTIESDQTNGTNNDYAAFALPCLTNEQRDKLQNVTPYVGNNVTYKIKPGTLIFNISVKKFQMFREGHWENASTNINTATGNGLDSSPFAIPTGTKTNVEADDFNAQPGLIYYASDAHRIRGYFAGNWYTLYGMFENTSATGISGKVPFVLPQGKRDEVEINTNTILGFTYVDTQHGNILRTYGRNNEWYTIDEQN